MNQENQKPKGRLDAAISEWLDGLSCMDSSKNTYIRVLRSWNKWLMNNKHYNAMGATRFDVHEFRDNLIKTKEPHTICHYLSVLRMFYRFLSINYGKTDIMSGIRGVKRGQLPTSVRKLAQDSGLNETTIRSYLDRLVRLEEISKESAGNNTKRGTIITICKYGYYTSTATERTTERPQRKQQREPQTTEIKDTEIKDFISVYARARETHNEFRSFKKLLKEIAPDLLEMRYRLSEKQYFRLKTKFGLNKFFVALIQIGNKNNTTQYISAYKTVKTYLENDQGYMQLDDYLCS